MQRHSDLEIYHADTASHLPLPYADQGIQAGFPSPAQDYINEYIDLNREIVRQRHSTGASAVTR